MLDWCPESINQMLSAAVESNKMLGCTKSHVRMGVEGELAWTNEQTPCVKQVGLAVLTLSMDSFIKRKHQSHFAYVLYNTRSVR